MPEPDPRPGNFLHDLIDADVAAGRTRVATRFPPEPNGYLHVGHAKSICLNFGLAQKYGGTCNLRFDDTNPSTEDVEYVESIQADVRWLGFEWQAPVRFASDYFEQIWAWAEALVEKGLAYVDSQSTEEIRTGRGSFYEPGKDSPYRGRSPAENLDLLRRMRAGEFPDGAHVLRAKIDMAHPNLVLRDPLMYRIRHERHHRTGDAWCLYPMYDWAHGLCDAIEGITHSICTLEFEAHRPLYDWFLEALELDPRPRQIEFAKLALTYTVLSKRRLLELVRDGHVSGWDDPRMPTLSGMRRRGYTAEALRQFCDRVGVAKRDQLIDVALLEHALREDLNRVANRVMGVLRPLEVVIENYPEGQVDWLDVPNHPEDPARGTRKVPFSRVVYMERDDFQEDPPKKWYRLSPGREVRLRCAAIVKCVGVEKDASGEVVRLRCTWDPGSRGGNAPDGRAIKGTSHWVSAAHAADAEVRLYDRLFTHENPLADEAVDWRTHLNPASLETLSGCKVEPGLAGAAPGTIVQFERLGYFCADRDGTAARPVFNRTIGLRDTWAKIAKQGP